VYRSDPLDPIRTKQSAQLIGLEAEHLGLLADLMRS
jgi:hypothetical protein